MKEAFFNFSQFSLPKFLLLFWHICPTFFWTIFKSTSPNQKGGFSFSFYPLLLVYFSGGFFFLVLFYFSNSLFTYSPTPIPFIRTLSPLYSDWFSFSLHSINSVSFQFAIQPSNSSNSYFFFQTSAPTFLLCPLRLITSLHPFLYTFSLHLVALFKHKRFPCQRDSGITLTWTGDVSWEEKRSS